MIHFSINKNLFLQALNTTKRAVSSKNAIPILSTVKIDVTNEGVTLIGSNGQISIENFISQKNEDAGLLITSLGSILLEASFFINVVSSLPDVTLDFKEIEQNQIVLTSGKSEITLKGQDTAYQQWHSSALSGKVRIVHHLAGRSAAKEKNQAVIDAIKAAHFNQQQYQTTTIINADDAIVGTGMFVKSSAEKGKKENPHSQVVLDEKSMGIKRKRERDYRIR